MPAPKIRKGDVVLAPFPFSDLSGNKVRPALIVSADPQGSELIAAFITSVLANRSPRGAEVALTRADPEFPRAGLKADSLIRLDKLVTLSTGIISRRLGKIGPATQARTNRSLRLALACLDPSRCRDMKKREVIRLVNARLQKVGHGISFDIITDGVRQEETWWHVPVIPTRNGKDIPHEVTVNIFANVEDVLEQKNGVTVPFIPAVPSREAS